MDQTFTFPHKGTDAWSQHAPESAPQPWQYNAASGDVARDSRGCARERLGGRRLAGADPDKGRARWRLPSDAFPPLRSDSTFAIRARDRGNDAVVRWGSALARFFAGQVASVPFQFARRRLARLHFGGFGGPRWQDAHPQSGPWTVWSDLQNATPARRGADFASPDTGMDGRQRVVERPEPPFSGSNLFALTSSEDTSYDPMGRGFWLADVRYRVPRNPMLASVVGALRAFGSVGGHAGSRV